MWERPPGGAMIFWAVRRAMWSSACEPAGGWGGGGAGGTQTRPPHPGGQGCKPHAPGGPGGSPTEASDEQAGEARCACGQSLQVRAGPPGSLSGRAQARPAPASLLWVSPCTGPEMKAGASLQDKAGFLEACRDWTPGAGSAPSGQGGLALSLRRAWAQGLPANPHPTAQRLELMVAGEPLRLPAPFPVHLT